MRDALGEYRLRMSGAASMVAGGVWLAAVLAVSWPALRWHLDYAAGGHPELFPAFLGFLVLAAFVAPFLYQRVRGRSLWRWEPAGLAGLALVALLIYEPAGTALTLWILASCYGLGATLLAVFKLQLQRPLERLAIATATGLGVFVWPLIVLGSTGLFTTWAFAGLLAAATALGASQLREVPALFIDLQRRWTESGRMQSPWAGFAVCLAALLLVCGLVVAIAPSITFDPLKFHLPLARHYAETGRLVPLHSDNYGYNPQSFEMLLAVGYRVAGQSAAQLLAPFFSVLFGLALLAVGRRAGLGRVASFTGAVFALAIPYIHMTGVNVKHDLVVGFLHLSSLLCYFRWRESRATPWIYLGVFLAATSLGFKHPAAFGVIGLGLLYIPAAWSTPKRARTIVVCALIMLGIGLFWQARSYWLTGDAFVYYNFSQPLPEEHLSQVGSPARRLWTLLTWPYFAHFDGDVFYRSVSPAPLGIWLMLMAPLWLLLRRDEQNTNATATLLFAVGTLIPWAFYVPLLRFVAAPVALLTMLSADRLIAAAQSPRRLVRIPLRLAAGYAAMFALCTILILEINAPQFRLLTGQITDAEYLDEALLTHASLEELGTLIDSDDRVLGLHNCSLAYAPDPDRYHCLYHLADNPEHVEAVLDHVTDRRFEFVVAPNGDAWRDVLTTSPRPASPVWTGPHYTIYELP